MLHQGKPCIFQATVLEEMPPFPERESSILAKLKKKKPSSVQEPTEGKEQAKHPTAQISNNIDPHVNIQPQVCTIFALHIYCLAKMECDASSNFFP